MHLTTQPMGKADLAKALGHATVSASCTSKFAVFWTQGTSK